MLLNNFIATLYPEGDITDSTGTTRNLGNLRVYNEVRSESANVYSETATGNTFAPFMRGMVFGSGTTPPQMTDYKIENHITTGLTYSGNNTTTADRIVSWVETVQNTSTAQITITEVGLFATYSQGNMLCLLTRTVLDTPVVLQPNEVKTFTITMDYNKFVDGTIIQNE